MPEIADEAERWRLTEELFHRAMELAPDARAGAIAAWCAGDAAMEASLLALVDADSSVGELISHASLGDVEAAEAHNFLLRTLAENAEPGTYTGGEASAHAEEDDLWVGRVLGAYRLERLLGRGGMGVVYLGQRVGDGLAQKVAVKLVGRHLRSSPAVAQFLMEREALAKLEHPHIARLLDGGVTEEGFPYVVMEYVEGRRLDTACDDPATTMEQLIRWMMQLCAAVTYVHGNLILHRDLKPGNVMVTAEGAVKLLDFGSLKRMGAESDTDSAMTQAGMRPMTVRYASPEHIQGGSMSTASDVFSLGMILYRLVAGRLPVELNDLTIGLYLEALREGKFAAPSELAGGARRLPTGDVARDLDAIVAKALRYEAQARYLTANLLAEDLGRVLGSQPVLARAGNVRYRAGKLYGRYRWAMRVGAAALVVLAVGLAGMTWQGHIARQQALRAQKGLEDERQLAHMLLFDYFEQLSLIPGSVEAQRKAVTRALAYLDGLAGLAPGSELELDTITGYTDMGNLLGNPYQQNLGNVPESMRALNKAVALAEARAAKHPGDLESLNALVKVDSAIGGAYMGNGNAPMAEKYLRAGTDTMAAMARDPKVTGDMLELGSSITDLLGDVYDPTRGYVTADLQKAEAVYQLSVDYDVRCAKLPHPNKYCSSGIVVSDYKFGMLVEQPDPALAIEHYKHGLRITEQFSDADKKTTRSLRMRNYMLSRLALMNIRLGRKAEGMALAREAQKGFREAIARAELDNRARFDMVAFETDLADECDRNGMEVEGEAAAKEVLGILTVLRSRSPENRRWAMIEAEDRLTAGKIEMKLGHTKEGAALNKQGLEQVVALAQDKDAMPEALEMAADALVDLHRKPGDAALAETFAERSIVGIARPTAEQLLSLASAEAANGKKDVAAKTARLALAQLTGPVTSKIIADRVAEAHRLAQ